MSILHTTFPDVSAILKGKVAVEWPGYVKACSEIAERHADPLERTLQRKRSQALKYLGSKACVNGAAAYSKNVSRIFTPEFVSELGSANSMWRARRNPWLKSMAAAKADTGNILPFGPQITVSSQAVSDLAN